MNMDDQINELIGKPYHPETYNCYHLVMELVPCAPDYSDIVNRLTQSRYFNESTHDNLIEVTDVIDGDIVLLGHDKKHLHHAGVYYKGYIVHADRPNVRAMSMADMKVFYPSMRYYRCKS